MKRIFFLVLPLLVATKLSSQTPITVKVDKRIELVRIIWNLAFEKKLPKEAKPTPSIYHDEVRDYFKKYKKHKAVQLLKDAWIFDYSFPRIAVSLDENFELVDEQRMVDWEKNYGKEQIRKILQEIKQFALASNFEAFFNDHTKDYEIMVAEFSKGINQTSWLAEICRLFDCEHLEEVKIYFEPLNNCGNYEISNTTGNTPEIGIAYLSDDPAKLKKEARKPVIFQLEPWIRRVFYHELGHFFTSGETYSRVQGFQPFYNRFYTSQEERETARWINQIDETLVRAYVAYLFQQNISEEKGVEEMNLQVTNYPMVDEVYKLIGGIFSESGRVSGHSHPQLLNRLLEALKSEK